MKDVQAGQEASMLQWVRKECSRDTLVQVELPLCACHTPGVAFDALKSSTQGSDFDHLDFNQVCSTPGAQGHPTLSSKQVWTETETSQWCPQGDTAWDVPKHHVLLRNKQSRCQQQGVPGLCSVAR